MVTYLLELAGRPKSRGIGPESLKVATISVLMAEVARCQSDSSQLAIRGNYRTVAAQDLAKVYSRNIAQHQRRVSDFAQSQNVGIQRNPAASPEFPGEFPSEFPGEFPGCWIRRGISWDPGFGVQFSGKSPGEFAGKSAASKFPENPTGNFQVHGRRDIPGNSPGSWLRQPPSRGIFRAISRP